MTWSTRAGAARVDRMRNSRRILSFCLSFLLSFCQLRFVVFSRFRRFVISFRRFVYFIPPFCRFVESRVRLNSILFHRYEFAVLSFCLCYSFVVFVLTIKILVNFTYLRRAVIVDREARIRERRGALLFALKEESAAKVNQRRFLSFTFF